MPAQTVTIQVGHCGNQIGCIFWNLLAAEHGCDENGQFKTKNIMDTATTKETLLDKIHTHCNETTQSLRYTPLTVIIDSDPGMKDDILNLSNWCNNDINNNSMFGEHDMDNNFAKGYYSNGTQIINEIMDVIRSKCEKSEYLNSFQYIYSIGGGTGSGVGSLINRKIKDEYPDKLQIAFIIYPSSKVSECVVEPYNVGLWMSNSCGWSQNVDLTINFDNGILYDMIIKNNQTAKYANLNGIVASNISDITSQWRFDTFNKLNRNYREFAQNMIPFPHLQHLSPAKNYYFNDINSDDIKQNDERQIVKNLSKELWNTDNLLVEHDDDMMNLVSSSIYRLNRNRFGLYDSLSDTVDLYASKMKLYELNVKELNTIFIPNNVLSTLSYNYCEMDKMNGSIVMNTCSIGKMFENKYKEYKKLYDRKSFIHYYAGEGGDECMMQSGLVELRNVVETYHEMQQQMSSTNISDLGWKYEEDEEYLDDEEYEEDEEEEDDTCDEDEDTVETMSKSNKGGVCSFVGQFACFQDF